MKGKGGVERELKFPNVQLDRLRDRLLELEAERVGPAAFEDNLILDREGELTAEGKLLRLRTVGQRNWVTFKGPMHLEGLAKVRVEHEIAIEGADQARALFECLGYSAVNRYQKVREEWMLGGVMIALDHTPIGDFAEFEGDGAETVARRCGLDPAKSERRSYLRLYAEHRKRHRDSPLEMVFPANRTPGS
jgi:adenylate cyclase, class 2